MKIVKITLWDGGEYYTDNQDSGYIRRFIERARVLFAEEERGAEVLGQLDIMEMTGEKYSALRKQQPTDAAALFGEDEDEGQISGGSGE